MAATGTAVAPAHSGRVGAAAAPRAAAGRRMTALGDRGLVRSSRARPRDAAVSCEYTAAACDLKLRDRGDNCSASRPEPGPAGARASVARPWIRIRILLLL